MEQPLARRMWAALEPLHVMGYFTPEPQEEYAAIGLDPGAVRMRGYVPVRSAPMGEAAPAVVHAAFFNFTHRAIEAGLAGVWQVTTPQAVTAARLRGVERALRRLCGDQLDAPATAEAADLAEEAAAGCSPAGRPLYAAHAALAAPAGPVLRLWWAITLLREFRGDGHVAALVDSGLGPVEAAVTNAASGGVFTRSGLQRLRGYTDQEWSQAEDHLRSRGWMDAAGVPTAAGEAGRAHIEERTDAMAAAPWQRLGEAGCTRLGELVAPLRQAVLDGDGFPPATRWRREGD